MPKEEEYQRIGMLFQTLVVEINKGNYTTQEIFSALSGILTEAAYFTFNTKEEFDATMNLLWHIMESNHEHEKKGVTFH